MKRIKISCRGADTAPYEKLINFQGDLKILTEAAYTKFKALIDDIGFKEPISVWVDTNDGDKLKILNGHQRLATVKRMVEKDGYQVDELPISFVDADSVDEAKKIVLALTSEFGEVSQDGLVNFLSDMNLKSEEIEDYLTNRVNLVRVSVGDVMQQIRELKVEIARPDPLDVGNIVVGSDAAPAMATPGEPGKKNDPMTGLRLVQIFLTDSQLADFKGKTDIVMRENNLDNLTEAIIFSVTLAATEDEVEKNRTVKTKKPKR